MTLDKPVFLAQVLDRVPHGVCVVESNFVVAYWNKILEDWTGLSLGEVMGKGLMDLYPNLAENRYKKRMDQVLAGGPPAFFSPQLHPHFFPLLLRGGKKRILQTVVSMLPGGDGRQNLLLLTLSDMTQPVEQLGEISQLRIQALQEVERRRQSEKRHLLHIQQTPLGVIEWDLDFKITEWNPSSERIFGYSRGETVARRAAELIIPVEQREQVSHLWQNIIDQKGGNQSIHECMTKDGYLRICEFYYTPLVQTGGDVMGMVILVHDITNRRKMEDELQESKKLEAVGLLAGGISHDFNNLLSITLGNLTMIKRNCMPGERKCGKWLDKIERASFQASELVKKLITFSEGGKQVRKEVSIDSVVDSTMNLTPVESNILYNIVLEPDLPTVFGDEMQLVQVFYNLFLNAGDAMPDGGTITVKAGNATVEESNLPGVRKGKYVKVVVTDSGVGIAKKFMDKIFDPYFTTKSTMTRKGIGLGLSNCYSIMQSHEGHISVESQLGKGTTVSLYLPLFKDV